MVKKQVAELLLVVLIAAYPLAAFSKAQFTMGGIKVIGVPGESRELVESMKTDIILGNDSSHPSM